MNFSGPVFNRLKMHTYSLCTVILVCVVGHQAPTAWKQEADSIPDCEQYISLHSVLLLFFFSFPVTQIIPSLKPCLWSVLISISTIHSARIESLTAD